MEVTSQALSAATDRDVFPADLSACGAPAGVQARWAKPLRNDECPDGGEWRCHPE